MTVLFHHLVVSPGHLSGRRDSLYAVPSVHESALVYSSRLVHLSFQRFTFLFTQIAFCSDEQAWSICHALILCFTCRQILLFSPSVSTDSPDARFTCHALDSPIHLDTP
jgi:hypothetical protein